MERNALLADVLDLTADPGWSAADDAPGVRWRPGHWLLVEGDRIAGVRAEPPDDTWTRHDFSGCLLTPGLVDTHVHMPQLEVIASYGDGLLDWLTDYTFPAESRYADPEVCASGAARFLDALLAHGTTSALVVPTVHRASVDALFAAAAERRMRVVAGQVLMDRNAPAELLEPVAAAERDVEELVARWHGAGRASYAVTVRFGPTSSDEELAMAGRVLARHPGLVLQTHVSENHAEADWVADLFPGTRSYVDVYARHGLIGPTSILAHGIWLDRADRDVLAAAGTTIAHCPGSNLFLGSGLMPWRELAEAGIAVTLGSDIGAGTSLALPRVMADAYKVAALLSGRLPAWQALYAATRGGARALGLEHEIGSFDTGTVADLAVWRWAVGPVAEARDARAASLHERVFAWMMLADERNLRTTWVAGRPAYAAAC